MPTIEQLNTALAGRYEIERTAGEGGMATVYLARDVRHNRKVALKVLKPELGVVLGPERFLTEIEVTANLHHPNLLPLFDSGEAGGILFYVMPYVEGETLRARLERERQFPVDEAVRIAAAVASALDYAHRHNVIHRDLKPENILLHEGQPLVMDFGIALAVSNAGGARVTQTGLSLGTPRYMSPEQATGDRQLDARTDIYSLAAICYEMLSGDPPHTGSTVQAVIAKVLTDHPHGIRSSRPAIPEHVEAAVMRGLAKLPADRFATAAQFTDALTGVRPVTMPAIAQSTGMRASARSDAMFTRPRAREMAAWVLALGALAAAALPFFRAAPVPPVPAQFSIELPESVTVFNGSGTKLALSRDGTQMVVVASKPGQATALYMRRLGDPVMTRVRGTDSARSPSFSPDGEWLLYSGAGMTLKKVPVVGGTPQVIADSAAFGIWGDRDRVVYVRETGARGRGPPGGRGARGGGGGRGGGGRGQGRGRGDGVWLTSSDGGEPRQLTHNDTTSGLRVGYTQPEVLPGGEYALVTYRERGTQSAADSGRLAVISLADGVISDLGLLGSNAHYVASGHIVFGRSGGEVYVAPFSLRQRAVTGPASLLLQDVWQGSGGAMGFAVAQNGTLAYHGSRARIGQLPQALFAVDMQGAEQQLTRELALYGQPRVSPDGKRVVLTMDPRIEGFANKGDLWIFEIATGTLTRLTSDASSTGPEWSRDGARIVYLNEPTQDSAFIRARPWDMSSGDVVLARGVTRGDSALKGISVGPARGLSALRRGSSAPGVNTNIWLAPTDSLPAMRSFITKQSRERGQRVSPDGRTLAYVSTESGRAEVYVTQIPGPGPHVKASEGGGEEPIWSPNGLLLYYRSQTRMMVASIAQRPALALTRRDSLFADVYADDFWHGAYDIFPDGRRFVMIRAIGRIAEAPTSVFVIVNWQKMLGRETRGAEGR
jgi:serine/threonine-protein kinase